MGSVHGAGTLADGAHRCMGKSRRNPYCTRITKCVVIAGLDPAIHRRFSCCGATWMPGSSPGMTILRLLVAYFTSFTPHMASKFL